MPTDNPWLRVILRLSAAIHHAKERMTQSGIFMTIVLAFGVMILEILLALVSLPSYVFLAPVPYAVSRSIKDREALGGYRLRRAVTLSALMGTLLIGALQVIFGLTAAWFSFGSQSASAANLSWSFNSSIDYVYNPNEVQIVDGAAIFRATTLVQSTLTTPTTAAETTPTIENSGIENGSVNLDTASETPVPENTGGETGVETEGTVTGDAATTVETDVTPAAPVSEPVPEPAVVPPPAPTPAPTPEAPPAPVPSGSLLYMPPAPGSLFAASIAQAAELSAGGNMQVCESTIRPLLPTIFSDELSAYTGFVEVASKNGGEISYQLSTDAGITWGWWNGSTWTTALLGTDGNTADEVNAHIGSLPVTTKSLMFKARFHNDCASDMQLSAISVEYDIVIALSDQRFLTLTALDSHLTFTDSAHNPILQTEQNAYVDIDGRHIAYLEADANVTLSSSSFNVSPGAVSINLGTPLTGVGRLWLLVPKNGADDLIRLCPSALLATDITINCLGGVTLSVELPLVSGFVLAYLDDPEYWYIEASLGIPSLGVASISSSEEAVIPDEPSPTDINEEVLTTINAVPSVRIDNAVQHPDGLVEINYTVLDHESHYVSLQTIEYSATGAFTGEEQMLHHALADDRDEGTDSLTTSPSGISHTLIWDPREAISAEANVVFFRFVADDGIETSDAVVFGPVSIDVAGPVIADGIGVQVAKTDNVRITYHIIDAQPERARVALAVSDDQGETWTPITVTTTDEGFLWDASADFPNVDNGVVTLRLTATDSVGNVSIATTEAVIDTKAPYGLAGLALTPTNNSLIVAWDALVAEAHFDRYTVRYTDQATGPLTAIWNANNDEGLNDAATTSTVITGLSQNTTYRLMLEAYDNFGHITVTATLSTTTLASAEEIEVIIPIVDTLPEIITETTVTVGGSATPGTTVDIIVDDEVVEENVPVESDGSFDIEVPLSEGAHEIEVIAGDGQSGEAAPSEAQTVVVTAPLVGETVNTPPTPSPSPRSPAPTPVVSAPEGSQDTAEWETSPSVMATTLVAQDDLAVPVQRDFAAVGILNIAKTSRLMPVPTVNSAAPSMSGTTIRLEGTSMPNSTLAVFLHSEQAVMYTAQTDSEGRWSFDHDQRNIELSPGMHTVYTVAYDEGSNVKSEPSKVITFEVKSTALSHMGRYFDLPTTLMTLFIALIALSTVLMLRRRVTS